MKVRIYAQFIFFRNGETKNMLHVYFCKFRNLNSAINNCLPEINEDY